MKKRILIYVFIAVVIFSLFRSQTVGPGASLSSYCRIHAGMTASDVACLLDVNGRGPMWRSGTPVRIPNQGCIEYWRGYAGTIAVVYDTRRIVVESDWNWDWHHGSFLGDLTGAPDYRE